MTNTQFDLMMNVLLSIESALKRHEAEQSEAPGDASDIAAAAPAYVDTRGTRGKRRGVKR